MKKCSICGKEYPDSASFCGECGVSLKKSENQSVNTSVGDLNAVQPVKQQPVYPTSPAIPAVKAKSSKLSGPKIALIIAGGVLLLLIIAAVIICCYIWFQSMRTVSFDPIVTEVEDSLNEDTEPEITSSQISALRDSIDDLKNAASQVEISVLSAYSTNDSYYNRFITIKSEITDLETQVSAFLSLSAPAKQRYSELTAYVDSITVRLTSLGNEVTAYLTYYDTINEPVVEIPPIPDGQSIMYAAATFADGTHATLRLRSEPGKNANVICAIPYGSMVTVVSTISTSLDGYTWIEINYNGYQGFAAIEYLSAVPVS